MALSSAQEAIHPATEPKLISWKVVVAGLLLIVASDYYINWSTVILRASKNNKALFPMGLFFPFVMLVGTNLLLRWTKPRWALNRGQLCVALGMGLIGSLFPFYGLASYVVGTIAAPYYFATPGKRLGRTAAPQHGLLADHEQRRQSRDLFLRRLAPGPAHTLGILGCTCILVDDLCGRSGMRGPLPDGNTAKTVGGKRTPGISAHGSGYASGSGR